MGDKLVLQLLRWGRQVRNSIMDAVGRGKRGIDSIILD
jgi:hypothetical protein